MHRTVSNEKNLISENRDILEDEKNNTSFDFNQ